MLPNILGRTGLMLALGAAVGCGGGDASVTGQVIYQGQPVTSGAVTFYGAEGRLGSGWIRPDGSYTVSQAPVGAVKVTVVPARPKAAPPAAIRGVGKSLNKGKPKGPEHAKPPDGAEPPPKEAPLAGGGPAIPEKYKDPERSPLSFTLHSGSQRIDLDLRP